MNFQSCYAGTEEQVLHPAAPRVASAWLQA